MKTATKSSTARDATFTPRERLSPKLRNSLEKLQSPHSAIPRGRVIPRGSTLCKEPIRTTLQGLPNFSCHGDAPGPRICGLAHSDFPGPHHSQVRTRSPIRTAPPNQHSHPPTHYFTILPNSFTAGFARTLRYAALPRYAGLRHFVATEPNEPPSARLTRPPSARS